MIHYPQVNKINHGYNNYSLKDIHTVDRTQSIVCATITMNMVQWYTCWELEHNTHIEKWWLQTGPSDIEKLANYLKTQLATFDTTATTYENFRLVFTAKSMMTKLIIQNNKDLQEIQSNGIYFKTRDLKYPSRYTPIIHI